MSQPTYLTSGSRVAVVGGGPAGAFFAIELLRRARALGLKISTDIYDGKNFARKGAPGCNMCAGAVGHNLIQEIERSTVPIPREVIHYELEGYAVHYQDSVARLSNDPSKKIYGVYRGAGPVSTEHPEGARSFDQFLLDQAVKLGARHIPRNVYDIDVPATLERRPALRFTDDERIEYDLVIGAFGVNSQLANRLLYGYVPPPRATNTTAANQPPKAPVTPPSDGVRRISVAELDEAMKKGGATIVDVRNEAAFRQARIKGAILVPVNEVGNRASEIPRDKLIVTYCS